LESYSFVKVFAPATVANVAAGFDVLGFALDNPGDIIELKRISERKVTIKAIHGDSGKLPLVADKNTASFAVSRFLSDIGEPFGVELVIHKRMPLKSGLGSSAASSVGAVFGANKMAGNPLSRKELIQYTMEAERVACGSAHADNTAPAILGGFVLIRSYDPLDVVKLPVPEGLACAVVHPHTEVNTGDARKILKKEISLTKAIRQWGNLAALVAALFMNDLELLSRSLQDVIAEPIRSLLIPGYERVKEAAMMAGALGCSISGSGPSVFALCGNLERAGAVGKSMVEAFDSIGLDSDLYVSRINVEGPRVIEEL